MRILVAERGGEGQALHMQKPLTLIRPSKQRRALHIEIEKSCTLPEERKTIGCQPSSSLAASGTPSFPGVSNLTS
jgi:hypothetical protein